ncbi:hypothetical protein EPA93_04535 [Ktedonosporobacter rubrisoli]|uniref:Uncharacterized protein n=1 Tax=Ktedonosporobacter rubrisoli TaxID=2509675 RepID=A0A4P6JJK8_KTERU|nr:hypothetical protein [Ktedonosporobacter rubrisoli]QBD75304.1 hypothetical protein EPA93_04535 [Ktedonosporobacter rubrisoli]
MLALTVADRNGLDWAQEQVVEHHYLHTPVDVRCSPVALLVTLFNERVGCLIFGRPETTKVNGWYGSLEDVRMGKCRLSRWEILNLARVWLDPSLQSKGKWYHPQDLIGPSILPGFYDRKLHWHSSVASFLIGQAIDLIVFHYLICKPPVWMDEPYQIREILSYCDSHRHKGTLYRASGFTLVRRNSRGIETYARPVRNLTPREQTFIALRSQYDPRCW